MRALLFAAMIVLTILTPAHAQEFSFETATLGTTGQGPVGSFSLDDLQYLGAKFDVAQDIHVTSVGGHIGSIFPGDLFAVIVPLDPITDLPATSDMSDALASATFTPVGSSAEIVVPMNVDVGAGRYALIFGAGLFGTSGGGYMPDNNMAVGSPETFYFDWVSSEYRNRVGIAENEKLRFFVTGEIKVGTQGSSWGFLKQTHSVVDANH